MNVRVPPVNFEAIVFSGGWDQTTPTLSLNPGVAKYCLNFECGPTGGYTRIAGYERFDGRPSPTDSYTGRVFLSVESFENTPAVGNTLTASGGATGVIAYIEGLVMVLCKVTGTFAVSETVSVGATLIGKVDSVDAGPATPLQQAKARNAVADIYRADIAAVPGSGQIRGVFHYNDNVYAFRDDAGGTPTSCDLYKSSSAGWTKVNYYKSVSFTAGGTSAPADGATLTQGAVTATIKRVVFTSGSWSAGSAAGQFVIATPASGHFSSGAATIGAVNVTLSGVETDVAMLPGGKFEVVEGNFSGQDGTRRIYGVDGKNKAFEFDGDVLVPITTGLSTDTPSHIAVHNNYLWLTYEASLMYSAPGLPYDWTALSGAGEIAVGENITGAISLPGSTSTKTMAVASDNSLFILYGTAPDDFNLVAYNQGTGAAAYSLRNMAQTFLLDDRGVFSLQTAIQYGNFAQAALTANILPYINAHSGSLTYTCLNREKSQYRLFFSNGDALYITVVNGKVIGSMTIAFPVPVSCAYGAKDSNGQEKIFFGSTDGYVYQMDKGTSFDGEEIHFYLLLNYDSIKSPRFLKRFRKTSLEIYAASPAYAEFSFGYSLGYGSREYEQPEAGSYSSYLQDARWDTFYWDDFFWDYRGIGPIECNTTGVAENISLAISGASDYISPFTVNSAVIHYTPLRAMR